MSNLISEADTVNTIFLLEMLRGINPVRKYLYTQINYWHNDSNSKKIPNSKQDKEPIKTTLIFLKLIREAFPLIILSHNNAMGIALWNCNTISTLTLPSK